MVACRSVSLIDDLRGLLFSPVFAQSAVLRIARSIDSLKSVTMSAVIVLGCIVRISEVMSLGLSARLYIDLTLLDTCDDMQSAPSTRAVLMANLSSYDYDVLSEQAKALESSNNALDYTCKYAQRIKELLVCVNASCLSSQKDSEKPATAKTKNMNRFELHFNATSLDGLKSRNGGDGGLKGCLVPCLMRIKSINRKKYILVIVEDYSWFTWVKFLRSMDEALELIIKFLKKVQVRLNATVRNIRTDNGTKFVNQTLKTYYEDPPSVVSRAPVALVAPIHVDTTDTPSSTLVDQDTPSASTSQTPEDSQEPVLHQDVEGQEPPNA
ncbi:retrovirus-related pol polyprotein from transposon TNT 1-94 [Tanacetum coccineum]